MSQDWKNLELMIRAARRPCVITHGIISRLALYVRNCL